MLEELQFDHPCYNPYVRCDDMYYMYTFYSHYSYKLIL